MNYHFFGTNAMWKSVKQVDISNWRVTRLTLVIFVLLSARWDHELPVPDAPEHISRPLIQWSYAVPSLPLGAFWLWFRGNNYNYNTNNWLYLSVDVFSAFALIGDTFQARIGIRNAGFWGEGITGVPGEKSLRPEKRTNNKLNPDMTQCPGIEPGTHWWIKEHQMISFSRLGRIATHYSVRYKHREKDGNTTRSRGT